jgi:type I restriction enzyme, S subunit
MTKRDEYIKPGYKPSLLGQIPSDWEVVRISDYGKVYTGNTPSTNDLENYGNEFLFVSPSDLGSDKYILNTEKKLSKKGFSISRKFPQGSVLFTCIGSTIGKSGIASVELTSNQQINVIVVDKKYSNEFLYYALENNSNKIRLLAGEQAVPILNKSQFESVRIICPPLPEQNAIVNILSLVDAVIEQNIQLIAKKELQKKWLMQNLLTGKKRVKGFVEDWKEHHLWEMFSERNETKYFDLQLLSVGASGIYPQSDSIKKDTSNDDKSKYKRICPGDIGYNTMRMWQGRSALSSLDGIVSPAYTIVTPKENADSLFFAYLFKTPKLMNLFWRNSQGLVDDTLNCKFKDFSIVKIHLPKKKEQTVIAEVLQTADNEIQLLITKTEKLREQKRGLMQVLLTGEKRLKINEHENSWN